MLISRRCRDCRWWRVRTGCVHPEITAFYRCQAVIPKKYEVYKFTRCRKYEGREIC
jgi:hypothetical protein